VCNLRHPFSSPWRGGCFCCIRASPFGARPFCRVADEHYCRVTLVAPRACAGRTGTKTAWWDRHASPRCATPIDLRMILSRGGCSSRRRRRRRRRRVAAGPRRLVPREGHHVEQHQQRDARPRRPVAAAGQRGAMAPRVREQLGAAVMAAALALPRRHSGGGGGGGCWPRHHHHCRGFYRFTTLQEFVIQ
jgi:hypothetical protein